MYLWHEQTISIAFQSWLELYTKFKIVQRVQSDELPLFPAQKWAEADVRIELKITSAANKAGEESSPGLSSLASADPTLVLWVSTRPRPTLWVGGRGCNHPPYKTSHPNISKYRCSILILLACSGFASDKDTHAEDSSEG